MATHLVRIFALAAFTVALSGQIQAQSDQGLESRIFGQGQPAKVADLPPGQLKRKIKALPPQARGNALKWLQNISFPTEDVDTLDVDAEGGIYYVDSLVIEDGPGIASLAPQTPGAAPQSTLDDAFLLHSKPGATNTVFIDFDGHSFSGTAWGSGTFNARAYSTDSDFSNFSNTERTKIVDIWHRVSEDLAPFDIDVTTQEPPSFGPRVGRVLVTSKTQVGGADMPHPTAGGVAYVGVFGASNYHTYYSPALVYFDNLGGGFEHYVAEASSHEFGHNLGLSHDGIQGGVTYYEGHGSDLDSWAPIMGVGYYRNVTQWSKGEYLNANQFQDDMVIIEGKLGDVPDDHGDSTTAASELDVDGSGNVVSSNPEFDPHNVLPDNKGVIEVPGDIDVFSFIAGVGTVNLTVTPAWDAFTRTNKRGANLDILAELRNVSGGLLASSNPATDTMASLSATVGGGTYYLLVTGVGNDRIVSEQPMYSDYDSLGQYFINGTVPPAGLDETAPEPNPMGFASLPAADSHEAISMTAQTATDETSTVEYRFNCLAGGVGCSGSGWQTGASYTAGGLAAGTHYTFNVEARDQAGNATAASTSASATTAAPPPPPVAPSGLTAYGVSESAIDLAWADNATTETGYRVERSAAGAGSYTVIANLGANANSYSDGGLTASTTYDYRVAAVNDYGTSAYTSASGTTDDPPPFVVYESASDTPMAGTVSGLHTATHSDNGSAQLITERESGGKKSRRYTYLEHRWNFNISSGAMVTVYAQAWKSGSNSSELFDLEYSLNNGSSFLPLMNVSSTNNGNLQAAVIPGAPSGAIILRVKDTHQQAGNRAKSTFHVDHLYIRVDNGTGEPPPVPPANPAGFSATAASTSSIDLAWMDASNNEEGFLLERSLNGSSGWTEIANLSAGSESHSDNGLAEGTRYYYRVSAWAGVLSSGYAEADATTDGGNPPPALSLSASAYKRRGKHGVNLDWDGNAANVDIYRGTQMIDANVGGSSYDDFIGTKGSASYQHKVCETGTSICSNTTTTVF